MVHLVLSLLFLGSFTQAANEDSARIKRSHCEKAIAKDLDANALSQLATEARRRKRQAERAVEEENRKLEIARRAAEEEKARAKAAQLFVDLQEVLLQAAEQGKTSIDFRLDPYFSKNLKDSAFFDGIYTEINLGHILFPERVEPKRRSPFSYNPGSNAMIDRLVDFCVRRNLALQFVGNLEKIDSGNPYGDLDFPSTVQWETEFVHIARISWF